MSNINNIRQQESGLVSIIVAITLITIISLITTSFALLARRESRQALDRQLSTQAFYAAESGINDAIEKIKDGPIDIQTCDRTNELTGNPDLGNGSSYTCVLVDESPTSLDFSPISADDGKTVRLQASENIDSIKISWQDANGGTDFATNSSHLLPQAGSPNNFSEQVGLLRASIIPITSSISRENLVNNSQTLFLYPKGDTTKDQVGTYGYQTGLTSQGNFVDGRCHRDNTPRHCNVVINGFAAQGQSTRTIYLRLKGIYRSANVSVQAFNAAGNPLPLSDGQAVIDATGKANDVLRRVQVRVPVQTQFVSPDFALESADSICKLISYTPVATFDNCSYTNDPDDD